MSESVLSPDMLPLVPPQIEGVSLKMKSPCLIVIWKKAFVTLFQTKTSGLPSALQRVLVELHGVRSRVETKAMREPVSLMVAKRLSSATKGPALALPARGNALAAVLVMRVNVPALRSK